MTDRPAWTDLRDLDDARWLTAQLKGTRTDVHLVVLHHDASTGAAVSLVRFPPGLERDELGCYPAAEELAILDGSLEFAGHTFVAGDYACVPPRVVRTPMRSPDGLLVLAWFSAKPDWLTDESDRVPGEVVRRELTAGPMRAPSADVAGRTDVVAQIRDDVPVDVGRDVLDVSGLRWCFAAPGQALPDCDGPAQVRTWA
jgi:hypothetical protein